ncbi:FMN-binding negative transcriptional regulator [Roseococcus sp. DSY-14]|uniref:FMN-binding negative transcriptional regulator n=1 Tax=Roseococcus sp. DSY-14 TaxID=3369650 RepID=UPI00387AF30A
MSLYNPPAFREERLEALLPLMQAPRLALLACHGPGGVPALSHLPLLTDGRRVVGHLARANPQVAALRAAGRAIAVWTGAEGYVSPSAYASKREHGKVVPTWNYEAVHAEGPVELVEDAARLREIVAGLTDHHEAGRPEPWAVEDAPEAFVQAQLKGIVGVVLTVEALSGKRKLSQNRPEADQAGVRAQASPALRAAMERG